MVYGHPISPVYITKDITTLGFESMDWSAYRLRPHLGPEESFLERGDGTPRSVSVPSTSSGIDDRPVKIFLKLLC